ncbi:MULTISPECIES: pyruvate kinase [unclassified Prochlorococcus]|uniref:pyruvate kinase n=1 Tax=unclassified Prochlorococcus TaxID=2627481 RepID=UPI000533823A|nr:MULTISPECIES: pyruvate kinase [unclassified Prochlorococcus]KGG15243.1 Pyruvate kinase [Prochlorococcus sp. MIT 0602]KGG17520.1 Pyruvate kinase [Prochlorococcus sp. MIT 0603]
MTTIDLKRRTKIVATIGPATESSEMISQLIKAGATTFRLNFSHGDHEEHAQRIRTIRSVANDLNVNIGILQDLQGPKIRLGRFKGGPITLKKGAKFVLTSEDIDCNQEIATVTYKNLISEVGERKRILLDDGRVEMVVDKVDSEEKSLICSVVVGGILSNNKGVNFPDVQLSINALTEKDKVDLSFGLANGVDWVALSFVRNPSDIQEIKELIRNHGFTTPVVAKIEKFEAIDQIDSILRLCDGVMVARGDLGVEMDAEEVPLLQKELIKKSNSLGIPIITATQMLDSMASCPRPTRAEVSDVANAILDGTDAVMLSNETAVGDYPIEAVRTMATIARRIERDYPQRALESHLPSTIPNAISAAVSTIARQLNAAAILPLTKSGATAHNVSKFRPATPIIAITSEVSVARRLQLVWGVSALLIEEIQKSTTQTFSNAMKLATELGILNPGDLVVETAGTLTGISGSTDLIKVGIVTDVVANGHSSGSGRVSGKLRLIRKLKDLSEIKSQEILVISKDVKYNPTSQVNISGIIFEGQESIKFSDENDKSIAIISSVNDACNKFHNGEIITLDLDQGIIYKGIPNNSIN